MYITIIHSFRNVKMVQCYRFNILFILLADLINCLARLNLLFNKVLTILARLSHQPWAPFLL